MVFVDPIVDSARPPTPLEKRLHGIYRSCLLLGAASIIGFLSYIGIRGILLWQGAAQSSGPFLAIGSDPVLYVFIAVTGLLICISMGALALLALLASSNENHTIIIVLLSSVGIVFGGSATYLALAVLISLFVTS